MLLCYITDRSQFLGDEIVRRRSLLRKIEEAAQAGVDYIQLREKDLPARELEQLARQAMQAIRRASSAREPAPRLLINSRTDISLAAGADGVHLPAGDIAPAEVRQTWKASGARNAAVISVSCHSPAEVARAAWAKAGLAIFAPVFEKRDSPGSLAAGLEGLRQACQFEIPVLALGGVTIENARACLGAGATGIAGIRLFQESDIGGVVSRLRQP